MITRGRGLARAVLAPLASIPLFALSLARPGHDNRRVLAVLTYLNA